MLHAYVHGRWKNFIQALVDFSKSFSKGAKVVKFVFCH